METTVNFSEEIKRICIAYFHDSPAASVYELVNKLMDMEGLPMHCPPHHFILPATLLTVCRKLQGADQKQLEHDLSEANMRASKVPGGFCGNHGTCGAAVGIGIFYSIFTHTTPLSTQTWSRVNRATGMGLLKISEVEGPRCCKRNLYLALDSAIDTIENDLGLVLERPAEMICKYYPSNRECKGLKCPYFPSNHKAKKDS